MDISVARVHLKLAHGALPALLPTPPNWKTMRMLPTPCVAVAAVLPKPQLAKPGRADSGERWDAHKTKSATSASSSPRSTSINSVRRSCGAGRGSPRTNATSPPPPAPKPGRADSVARWDVHKKAAANPAAASPSLSSSGTSSSSLVSSKRSISRASSAERWDAHKKRGGAPQAELVNDDGESSSTGSNDVDMDTEEEILWKPRAMYAGKGFVVAAPERRELPVPTAFLVRVA